MHKKSIITAIIIFMNTILNSGITHENFNIKNKYVISSIKNINLPNNLKIINTKESIIQIQKIQQYSPRLYKKNFYIYTIIKKWLQNNGSIKELKKLNIKLYTLKNVYKKNNIKFTSYYTPIINAKKIPDKNFLYPIYSIPYNLVKHSILPTRKKIYQGILNKKYILAYSNSLIQNFFMDIQGSGLVNFKNKKPLVLFSYSGKNHWPYTSIGKTLIHTKIIKKKNVSLLTILNWSKRTPIYKIKSVLETNKSFVFFKPRKKRIITGALCVPLIPKTAVASDKTIIPPGSIILSKFPVLDKNGKYKNCEIRLLIALDTGAAIKNQKLDIYQGIGELSGIKAGFYNHYGSIWILK